MGRQRRPVPDLLAPKLLRIRERLGIGQVEMARLLRDTPIPPDGGTISRFERGEREPNLFLILEYAKLGKINPVLLIDDQYSVRFMDQQIPKDVLRREKN